MGKIQYPSMVETHSILITPKRLNYSVDDLTIIIANECKAAAENNTIKLLTISILKNDDLAANSQNTVLKVLLPIFPEYYQIEKSIAQFVGKMNSERDFILQNINVSQFINFENGDFEKYKIFFNYPEMLVSHIMSPSAESTEKIKIAAYNMKKIAEQYFPEDMRFVENYIQTGFTESEIILKLMKTYLNGCEGKKTLDLNTPENKKDPDQCKRLINYLLSELNQKQIWAEEMIDQPTIDAIEKLSLFKHLTKAPVQNSLFDNRQKLSSSFELITNFAEICQFALQKGFGE